MTALVVVKGMVLYTAPQGEYGKRLLLLTDSLGKITAFAFGAAKTNSKMIGSLRPFTAGEFTLKKGRGAWNLHEIRVMDSFIELSLDVDLSFYAFYMLEVLEYFSAEGMNEEDSKELLNLAYLSFDALRSSKVPDKGGRYATSPEFIRHIFRLRILKAIGEYTLLPEGEEDEVVKMLWTYTLSSPLSVLYKNLPKLSEKGREHFSKDVDRIFKRQVPKIFHSEKLLSKK